MIVYNLFLYLSVRDQSYLWYALYVSFLLLYFMGIDGVGFHLLWSDSDWFAEHLFDVFVGAFECAFILFVKSFLETPKNTPTLDKILSFCFLVGAITAVVSLFFPVDSDWSDYPYAVNGILFFIVTLTAGIRCMKRGYAPAKYFLVASSVFLGGLAFFALQILKILPGSEEIGLAFMRIGSLLEAVLFSLALADRLKYERQQKIQAQHLALENLQKANQLKDEFLANTSHELRTPLHGMIGLAEATLQNLPSKALPQTESNLSLIVSNGRRLSLLVNDILDFSKLKHKAIPLNRQPVSFPEVLESVLSLSRTLLHGKPIQLINQVKKHNLPPVFADETRLEQILYNLISNAIKFTLEGSIVISARHTEDQILISVADTGIGIPTAQQSHIFNAFEQIDGTDTRPYGGTGLGLSIVRQLVELHEGTLMVESEMHQGSVFTFSLPVATKSKQTLPIPAPSLSAPYKGSSVNVWESSLKDSQKSTALTGFLDILIVDDDPVNLEVLRQQLASNHYRLREARNGLQALQSVEQKTPDLILLDIMMPEMSGFEVCERLRKHHQRNALPILFLTAKNRETDVIRGFEIGGNDYVTKPFFHHELIQRVAAHLEISVYQKQLNALMAFANKIHQHGSSQEMLEEAFSQITHWSFADEMGVFQGDHMSFHHKALLSDRAPVLKPPTKTLLKQLSCNLSTPRVLIANSTSQSHPLGQFYQPGHFLFVIPPQFSDHLLILFRFLERNPFQEPHVVFYIQSVMSQVQTTQDHLQSFFDDDKLVAVIGQVQPRLFEITHIKSTSPTLEIHFDSDKRPEYIKGCSLEKLNLYFRESALIRIHNSYLVNPLKVIALQKTSKSRLLKLQLTSGEVIPVGPTYVEKIRQAFAKLMP